MTTQTPYKAPAFSLKNSATGKSVQLKDFSGSWLVLYFYPKDDTPGCTVEACGFRDNMQQLTKSGAMVVGISKDDLASHEAFRLKYELNFQLLSDPDGEVIEAYGAWGPKMFGKIGILRKTFIINPDGEVVHVFGRVKPEGHAEAVLAVIEKLQTTAAAS